MKRTLTLTMLFFLITASYHSQIRYGGMQQLGLNFSQSGYNPGFIIVNGIRFSHFFAGIGADIQFKNKYNSGRSYFNNSAIYFDGRYYMNKQKNFFCKINAGVNLVNEMLPESNWMSYDTKAGYYGASGIGFKARMGKEVFYTIELSYCMRQTRYNQSFNGFNHFSSIIYQEPYSEKVDFRRNSIMVSVGLEIF